MLTSRSGLVALMAMSIVYLGGWTASAAHAGERCDANGCWKTVMRCDTQGDCRPAVVYIPKAKPPRTVPGRVRPARSERVCTSDADRHRVDCTGDPRGRWSARQQCFLRRPAVLPPKTDPVWQGHEDGSVWICTPYGYSFTGQWQANQDRRLIWLPSQVVPPTVQVDPEALARQAVASMRLLPPPIAIAPHPTPADNEGFVGMPVWMWLTSVTPRTWGPITRSAAIPGLSVTATATVSRVVWAMGDGHDVVCTGPGTPYRAADHDGVEASPDCGYVYEHVSAAQPNGRYRVTARAEWKVVWQSSLGESGEISLPLSSSVSMRIGELRPVLVAPSR
jgi:hypothetical protein